jgi:hypothetical protein
MTARDTPASTTAGAAGARDANGADEPDEYGAS